MKIVEKNIADLIQAEYNPRQLNTEQYEQIKSSLLRFGIVDPVLVNMHEDRKNVIIGGHQRSKVWKDLGNKTIPCVELSLDLEKEKELNVRLNKNTGEFDFEMLSEHFEMDDLCDWGFDESEFDFLNDGDEPEVEEVEDLSDSVGEGFQLIIEFESEMLTEEAYNKLTEEGYKCRISIL